MAIVGKGEPFLLGLISPTSRTWFFALDIIRNSGPAGTREPEEHQQPGCPCVTDLAA